MTLDPEKVERKLADLEMRVERAEAKAAEALGRTELLLDVCEQAAQRMRQIVTAVNELATGNDAQQQFKFTTKH